jgi:hypothetical protein
VLLLRLHPEVAYRSCDDCRVHEYDDSGKQKTLIEVTPDGEIEVPKKRPPGAKLPCETNAGCPKGHWLEPKGFTPASRLAYEFFCECRATGDFPRDPIVRKLAAAIDNAERIADRIEAREIATMGLVRKQL